MNEETLSNRSENLKSIMYKCENVRSEINVFDRSAQTLLDIHSAHNPNGWSSDTFKQAENLRYITPNLLKDLHELNESIKVFLINEENNTQSTSKASNDDSGIMSFKIDNITGEIIIQSGKDFTDEMTKRIARSVCRMFEHNKNVGEVRNEIKES